MSEADSAPDGEADEDRDEEVPVGFWEALRDVLTDSRGSKSLGDLADRIATPIIKGKTIEARTLRRRLHLADRYYQRGQCLRYGLSLFVLAAVVWLSLAGQIPRDALTPLLAGIVGSLFVTPRKPDGG
ncbi:MAG: hypothetical protein AB7T63_10600 [Planctomycetota bacterium]